MDVIQINIFLTELRKIIGQCTLTIEPHPLYGGISVELTWHRNGEKYGMQETLSPTFLKNCTPAGADQFLAEFMQAILDLWNDSAPAPANQPTPAA